MQEEIQRLYWRRVMLKLDKFILLVIFNAMTTNLKRFVVQ